MRKTFNNYDNDLTYSFTNYILFLNKFVLKAFNSLFYNWKISALLVANYLLNLSDHYFPKINLKTINITLLQAKFLLILNS